MSFLSARERLGLTQREVAERMGVDQSAVSQWETGKTHPKAGLLVRLSQLYNCSVDELLKDDPEQTAAGCTGRRFDALQRGDIR